MRKVTITAKLKFFGWTALALIAALGCSQAPEVKPLKSKPLTKNLTHRPVHEKATKHPHSHGGKLRHDFSDATKWAKMFDDPKRVEWQKPEEVVRLMNIKPGMVVADLGAGTGYFLPHLNKAVGTKGRVVAVDVEKSLIHHIEKRIMRQKLGATTAQLSPKDDPQLKAKSVNQVLIVDTWHHIENRTTYAKKLKNSLKAKGKIVIVDFLPNASGPGPKKEHRLDSSVVVKELKAAGLRAEVLTESLPYQYIVVGHKI